MKSRFLLFLFSLCACGIFCSNTVFAVECGKECKITGSPNNKGNILETGTYAFQTEIKTTRTKQDKCKTSYDNAAKCSWWCGCKTDSIQDSIDVIKECSSGYIGVRPTSAELNDKNTKNHLNLSSSQYYQSCVKKGEKKDTGKPCPNEPDYSGAKTCNIYYVDSGDGKTAEEKAIITDCEENYEKVEMEQTDLDAFGITTESDTTLYSKCAKEKCVYNGSGYDVGYVMPNKEIKESGTVQDYVCMRKSGEDADWMWIVKTCPAGTEKQPRLSENVLKDAGYVYKAKNNGEPDWSDYSFNCVYSGKVCKTSNFSDIAVNGVLEGKLETATQCGNAKKTDTNVNLVETWELYCAEDKDGGNPELQCRPKACKDGYRVVEGKCSKEKESNNATSGVNSNSNDKDVPENKNNEEVKKARDKIKSFINSVDKNKTVWKTAEGKFNTARLASDLGAGVVLGTVGGVVSGVVIKKKQLEKGFDMLHCTVGGQSLADFGDDFKIGYTRM